VGIGYTHIPYTHRRHTYRQWIPLSIHFNVVAAPVYPTLWITGKELALESKMDVAVLNLL
jgi:hypothetical protein